MTILINGIEWQLAAHVAYKLSSLEHLRVIGVGRRAPPVAVGRTELLIAPLTAQKLVDVLQQEQVDTVLHLDIAGEEQPVKNREVSLQHNVLGTMSLLGACVTAGVKRVVLRSSTFVYGATPAIPAFVKEDQPLTKPRQPGLLHDYVEIETFVAEFAKKHPHMRIVVLRCAGLVGKGVWSPLSNYLSQRMPATLIGYAPRIQVLHIDDAVSAFALAATTANIAGAWNIAADGVDSLSRTIRLVGKQSAQVPEFLLDVVSHIGIHDLPCGKNFLKYSCIADTQRAHHELGWNPHYDSEGALRDIAAART